VETRSAGADEAAGVGLTTGVGSTTGVDSTTGVGSTTDVGCTTGAGPPVDPTNPPRRVERSSVIGDGVGVGCTSADEPTVGVGVVAGISGSSPPEPRIGSRGLLASVDDRTGVGSASCSGVGVGVTITRGMPDDDARRAGLEDASSGSSSSGVADARWLPVPGWRSDRSGTGVTMISLIEVTVVGRVMGSLLLTMISDDVSGTGSGLKMGFKRDERSNACLDSICSEEVLESEFDVVGAAGAVALVTI
jgi:hypothetical protein